MLDDSDETTRHDSSIYFFFPPYFLTFSPSYCLYLIVVGRRKDLGTVIFISSCAFGESGRVKVPSWGVWRVGRTWKRLQALLDSIQPAMDCTIVMKSRGNEHYAGFVRRFFAMN